MKIVKIDWIDARTLWEVLTKEDLMKEVPIEVTTVGYLVDDNENVVILSSMLNKDVDKIYFKTSHIIPKCLIKKIEVMKCQ